MMLSLTSSSVVLAYITEVAVVGADVASSADSLAARFL